jgi:hypothetical protein
VAPYTREGAVWQGAGVLLPECFSPPVVDSRAAGRQDLPVRGALRRKAASRMEQFRALTRSFPYFWAFVPTLIILARYFTKKL